MIIQLTLKKIDYYTKDKQGNPLKNQDGRIYTRCVITDSQGVQYSGFGNRINEQWQIGQTVTVDAEQKEYKGKLYWNFKSLNETQELELRVRELEKYKPLLRQLATLHTISPAPKHTQEPPLDTVTDKEDELPEDLPFN